MALVPGAGATAGYGPPLRVVLNGAPEFVSASDLSDHFTTERLTVRTKLGDGTIETETPGITGVTVPDLFALLDLSPAAVTAFDVTDGVASDPVVALSTDEVRSGFTGDPGVCGSPCQAVVDTSGSSGTNAVFFRPLRSPTDTNGNDKLQPPDHGVLSIAITTTGTPFEVSATADDANPDPGQPVTFRVAGAPSDARVSWSFGDGSDPGGGVSATHTYPTAGRYQVTVSANETDGSSGSDRLTIQVGAPVAGDANASTPQTATNGAAGGGSGGNGSGGGSAATGGGNAGAAGAASGPATSTTTHGSGATTGKAKKTGTVVPRSGDHRAASTSTATGGGKASTSATSTKTATGSATTNAGAKVTTPSGSSGTASTAAPGTHATTPATAASTTPVQSAAATTPPTSQPGTTGDAHHISGLAVDSRGPNIAAALTAADALAAQTPPRSAARAAAGHGTAIAGGLTGGLVIIGLLGLGAAREWRRLPSPLPTP